MCTENFSYTSFCGNCSLLILFLKLLFRKCVTYVLGCPSIKALLTSAFVLLNRIVFSRSNGLMIKSLIAYVWWIKRSKVTDFKSLIRQSTSNKYTFEDSPKRGDIFRTEASNYDGAFLWIYLTAYYFRNKSSIIDVRLGYI